MVHRLLAVAIGADASYPALLDKKKTQVRVDQTLHNQWIIIMLRFV